MTLKGPFQPCAFCDSVILSNFLCHCPHHSLLPFRTQGRFLGEAAAAAGCLSHWRGSHSLHPFLMSLNKDADSLLSMYGAAAVGAFVGSWLLFWYIIRVMVWRGAFCFGSIKLPLLASSQQLRRSREVKQTAIDKLEGLHESGCASP